MVKLRKMHWRYAGKAKETRHALYQIPRGWRLESAVSLPETRGKKEYMVITLKKKLRKVI